MKGATALRSYFFLIFFLGIGIAGCSSQENRPWPKEAPKSVVEQFYEYISESGIRGGSMAIKEAYKMVSTRSQMSQSRFIGIIKKYPPGFKVDVVGTEIDKEKKEAVVTIEYRMASMFSNGYTIKTQLSLLVDDETWKIDFTGESDDQDVASINKGL